MPNDYYFNRIEKPDYKTTLLDDIPIGWKYSFAVFFCQELKEALTKLDLLDSFKIEQIKEKFGALCVYTNSDNEEIQKVIDKYKIISLHYCVDCGSFNAF